MGCGAPQRKGPAPSPRLGERAGPACDGSGEAGRNSPLGDVLLHAHGWACQVFFPRFEKAAKASIQAGRCEGERRLRTQNSPAKGHASHGHPAKRGTVHAVFQREGSDCRQSSAAIETGQIIARRNLHTAEEKAPAQRVEDEPAGFVLDGGKAMPEAALQHPLPGMIRPPAKDDPGALVGVVAPMGRPGRGLQPAHAVPPGKRTMPVS